MPIPPRTYTAAEEVVLHLSHRIMASGKTYKEIGAATNLSPSTISNIAIGETRWPRPKTLFALLSYFRIRLVLEDEDR